MRRAAVLSVVAVAVLAFVASACGSDSSADPDASEVTAESVASTDDAPADTAGPTSLPPTTIAATTLPPTTTPPAPTTPPSTPPATNPPVTDAPATTLPPFPPSLSELPDPPDVWSVVLAGSPDFDDPVLAQAIADASAAGYDVGVTDCDEGAAEALGMAGDGVYTITVYLNSETDAHAAADAFAARDVPATVALVHLFCLD